MSDTLMFSVSGLRGIVGVDLTPELVARYAAALGSWARSNRESPTVVLGRDARTSGLMFSQAAAAGFASVGVDVIDLGVVPTPTTQLAVEHHGAAAGLILTASHNPVEWNALKFVGPDGAFLDGQTLGRVKTAADGGDRLDRCGWADVGSFTTDDGAIDRHLSLIHGLPYVDGEAIRSRRFHVALDCVRGAGGRIIPALLEQLGCTVSAINLEPDGRFPREPEPVPENLGDLSRLVKTSGADIGLAVDPDVDRLALVDETGTPIGEDYTLAFAVRAVLGQLSDPTRATVVTNLSTSLVVEDAARASGARLTRAPVGEANVVATMRKEKAVIGGEGNGGVILPDLHAGRDAPLAVALVLQYLCSGSEAVSERVAEAPRYRIVKDKVKRGSNLDTVYRAVQDRFPEAISDRTDGLRLAWKGRWLHLRPSGTEPVIRIIAEASSTAEAGELVSACRDLL